MYLACRHIKTNGIRCESPALRGHAYCYFHSKLHGSTKIGIADDMHLPIPETTAAVQLSIGQIFEGLLSSRLDAKKAGQLLWGLQIAIQTIQPESTLDKSVDSLTVNKDGEELAPEARVCNGFDDCRKCKFVDNCPNWLHRYLNAKEHEDDDDKEDEEDDD